MDVKKAAALYKTLDKRGRSHFWDIVKASKAHFTIHAEGRAWPIPEDLLHDIGSIIVVYGEGRPFDRLIRDIEGFIPSRHVLNRIPPRYLNDFIKIWKRLVIKTFILALSQAPAVQQKNPVRPKSAEAFFKILNETGRETVWKQVKASHKEFIIHHAGASFPIPTSLLRELEDIFVLDGEGSTLARTLQKIKTHRMSPIRGIPPALFDNFCKIWKQAVVHKLTEVLSSN